MKFRIPVLGGEYSGEIAFGIDFGSWDVFLRSYIMNVFIFSNGYRES